MARIACFIDSDHVRTAIEHEGQHSGHTWRFFAASALDGRVRTEVAQFMPELVLLETLPHRDTTHLFVFLRSDQRMGDVPVVLVSADTCAHDQRFVLHADGHLQHPFAAGTFWQVVSGFVPEARAAGC